MATRPPDRPPSFERGPNANKLTRITIDLLPDGRVRIMSVCLGRRDAVYAPVPDARAPQEVQKLLAELGLNPEAGALPTHDELVQRHADHVARIAAAAPGLCAAGGAV